MGEGIDRMSEWMNKGMNENLNGWMNKLYNKKQMK